MNTFVAQIEFSEPFLRVVDFKDPQVAGWMKDAYEENLVLDRDRIDQYWESLVQHISYVQEATEKFDLLPPDAVDWHDQSKFTEIEFFGYASYFPERRKQHKSGFQTAWHHHLHHNPHHWQYWQIPPSHDKPAIWLPMPVVYVREMVCDWLGAGRAYQGSWDMTSWLEPNLPGILKSVHPLTGNVLRAVLTDIGYGSLVKEIHDGRIT